MNRVLLIDDDDDFRIAFSESLKEEGYEVSVAESVTEGLNLLNSELKAGVIVLDWRLPIKNGHDFLKQIYDKIFNYRIIVLTAYLDLSTEEAKKFKIFRYLSKGNEDSIKYAIDQAFKDIENEKLRTRINKHTEIHKILNSDEKESNKLNRALELICNHTLEQIDGYTCHVRLLDWKKGDYELRAFAGPQKIETIFSENKNINDSFSGEAAKEGKPIDYPDLQTDEKFIIYKSKLLREDLSDNAKEYLETVKSAYIIPIKTGLFENQEQVDAVFNISSSKKNYFIQKKIETINEFASHLKIAISKHLLQEKREEIHEDYSKTSKLLLEISEKLKESNIDILLEIVLQKIAEIINAEMVTIFLENPNSTHVESWAELAGDEIRYNTGESYAKGKCLTGYVYETGMPYKINDNPTKDSKYKSDKDIDLTRIPSHQLKHYLGVPLKINNKTIGVIRVNNKKSSYYEKHYPSVAENEVCLLSRGFSRDCQIILEIIANHFAVTVKNFELINKQNEIIKQLKALTDVSQRISSNYGLETKNLFKAIVEETAKVMNTSVCMLFWKDEKEERVALKECQGIDPIPNCYYAIGEYITGKVAQDGIPVCREKDKNYQGKYDLQVLQELKKRYGKEREINSYMIAPIIVWDDSPIRNNKIYGVLKVINKKPNHAQFTKDDLEIFKTFASQLSIAFAMSERNKSLFKLVQGVGHEIRNTIALIPSFAENQIKKVTEVLSTNNKRIENVDVIKDVKKYLNIIKTASEEAIDFSEDLLGFAENKFKVREDVELNNLIKDEIKKIKTNTPPSIINVKKIKITPEFAKDREIISNIYRTPFSHVIRNIIANAYQAMEEKDVGELIIKTYKTKIEKNKEVICIEIKDTGKGIEESKIPQIFNSDFSERDGGNGLGLWLVKISLLRMDGWIDVVESILGTGTTFKITLPVPKNDKRLKT